MNKKKNLVSLIKILSKSKSEDINDILEYLSDDAVDNVCECVYNVIHTDLKLNKRKKQNLKKFLKSNCSINKLKTVSSKKIPIFKRRKALTQIGKGLPLILGTALPFLIDLIFGKK